MFRGWFRWRLIAAAVAAALAVLGTWRLATRDPKLPSTYASVGGYRLGLIGSWCIAGEIPDPALYLALREREIDYMPTAKGDVTPALGNADDYTSDWFWGINRSRLANSLGTFEIGSVDMGNYGRKPRTFVRFPARALVLGNALLAAPALLMACLAIVRRIRAPAAGACGACGYDLTGNVTGRCPECGAPAAPPSA